jgi:Brp/Blh family beta-carotene 15,15'-monooxygenase
MNKLSFIFLCAFLIIVTVFAGLQSVDISYQLIGSLLFIVLLGIPHGAIDHIIFLEDNRTAKPIHFYGFYFGLMGLYVLSWAIFPMLSLMLFLIVSAYHFGQSQFSDLTVHKSFRNHILYFVWGCSILSGLILYNIEDILSLSSLSADMLYLSPVFDELVFSFLLPLSSIVTVFLLIVTFKKNRISGERFLFEIYLFVLIHICFYILPLIVGFTLYFVILHSFKVLSEEFTYLKSRRDNFSIRSFLKLLFPITLISVFGGGIIMLSAQYQLIGISNGLLVFVLISVLTLPHSIVMDDFYQKFMKKAS